MRRPRPEKPPPNGRRARCQRGALDRGRAGFPSRCRDYYQLRFPARLGCGCLFRYFCLLGLKSAPLSRKALLQPYVVRGCPYARASDRGDAVADELLDLLDFRKAATLLPRPDDLVVNAHLKDATGTFLNIALTSTRLVMCREAVGVICAGVSENDMKPNAPVRLRAIAGPPGGTAPAHSRSGCGTGSRAAGLPGSAHRLQAGASPA